LEQKLRLLATFASEGPVDAVVVGSSVADYGFSAERFGQAMSARLGREYRAFNFSTGAAEASTFPKLYRLIRTVARPRTLIVVSPPGIKRGDDRTRSPD